MTFMFLQTCLATAMFLVTLLAGSVPMILWRVLKNRGRDEKTKRWMSYLSCFSGGIFFATVLLDVLPHIGDSYEELVINYGLKSSVPLQQIFLAIGFFVIYLIEEVIEKLLHRSKDDTLEVLEKENTERSTSLTNADTTSSENQSSHLLKNLTFAVAISFHSYLEGFALGVQDTTSAIYALFVTLLVHKSIESFSVGIQFLKNDSRCASVFVTILIYSLMTPLGALTGTFLQTSTENSFSKALIILFLESMAAGTFVYVCFVEIIGQEKAKEYNSIVQLAWIVLGFIAILTVQFWFEH